MTCSVDAIRSFIDCGKTIVAIALNPGKDLAAFYEGLSPFVVGAAERNCQVIFLTVDSEINGNAYLERQFGLGVFACPPESYPGLDFVDVFLVFDYCSYAWRFPERAKVVSLAHYLDFSSPVVTVSLFGYRTDYLFLIRGSKGEWSRKLRQIEVAAASNFPHRMLKKTGCLIPGGYPEVDALMRGYRKSDSGRCITFCTTGATNNDDTLRRDGGSIVACLLESFPEHTIVFRPTPSDRRHELVLSLEQQFSGNPNFRLDCGDLQTSINGSDVFVSDCTGLKEVFSLVTGIPYIHADFSAIGRACRKDELGYRVTDTLAMVGAINRILDGERLSETSIAARLSNPGRSALYLLENIDFVINDKKNDEWLYYENRKRRGDREITGPEGYYPYIRKYIRSESMRSMSLRIVDFAVEDFPQSAFLWAIKAKLHFYRGEYDRATQSINTANRLSSKESAETIEIDHFDSQTARARVRMAVKWLISKAKRLHWS